MFLTKNLFLIIFLLVVFGAVHAQDFEGVVHYESSFESKDSTITAKELGQYFGTKTLTYYKNGFYKEKTNGNFMELQLWRHDENAIFYQHAADKDTLRVTSTKLDGPIPFEYKLFKKSDTILNKPCDKLILKDGYSTRTYYYSSELPLDPSFYMEYDKAHKNAVMEIMRAYYLRLNIEFPDFIVDVVATKIEEKELDDEIFEIPEHAYLKKE